MILSPEGLYLSFTMFFKMFQRTSIVPALIGAALVNAHGFVSNITVGATTYQNYDPLTFPNMTNPPDVPGWTIDQPDLGYIEPREINTPDIICHRSGTPGPLHIPVVAGETITMQWNTWPEGHKGPVLDYLAPCNGSCTTVDKKALQFLKIQQTGLIDASENLYAADALIAANYTWEITVPTTLPAGNYVLRHEIIALHRGGEPNGAQLYPQCVNLEVRGEVGDENVALPSGTLGRDLYTPEDPGILFDVWAWATEYAIPGPTVYSG